MPGCRGVIGWGHPRHCEGGRLWWLPRLPRQCLESTVPRFSDPVAPWGGRGAWSSSPGFPQTSAVLPGSFWRDGNSSDLQGVWTADQSTFDFKKRGPVRELLEIRSGHVKSGRPIHSLSTNHVVSPGQRRPLSGGLSSILNVKGPQIGQIVNF